jgi:hypothetical protein
MSDVKKLAKALLSYPCDDVEMRRHCALVTLICMSFQTRADNENEPFDAFIVDKKTGKTINIDGIHAMWVTRGAYVVAECSKTITHQFEGERAFVLSDTLTLRIVAGAASGPCSCCGTTYISVLNRKRCEASHARQIKKKKKYVEDRTPLRLDEFVSSWDEMQEKKRDDIRAHCSAFLPGILGSYESFSAPIRRLLAFVGGKTDIKGPQLALALNEATEHTFMFRMVRAVQRCQLHTKHGYVAAIAHVLIVDVLNFISEAAAQRLLDEEAAIERETAIREAAQEAKREVEREKQRWSRLERVVWSSRPIACWADE